MRHWIDILTPPRIVAAKPSLMLEFAQSGNRQLGHVVQVLSQHLGTLYRIGGKTRIYDIGETGQRGALFSVGTTLHGIGLGWKDSNGVSSIYAWNILNPFHAPDYAIDLPPGVEFDNLVPEIVRALNSHQFGKIPVPVSESLDEESLPPQPSARRARRPQTPDKSNDVEQAVGPLTDPRQADPRFQNMLTLARAKEINNLAKTPNTIYILGRAANGAFFSVPGTEAYSARMERMLASVFPQDESRPSMEQQYEELASKVELIASGRAANIKSTLIVGAPSSGKSYNILKTLKQDLGLSKNKDFVVSKGMLTRPQLYRLLIENLHGLVILDDCDGIIKDEDAVNMLKGALDTDAVREVTYRVNGTINISVLPQDEQDEYVERLSRVLRGKPDASDPDYFARYARVKSARNTMPKGKPTPDEAEEYDDEDVNRLYDDPDDDDDDNDGGGDVGEIPPGFVPDEQQQAILNYVTNHLPNVIDWKGRMIFISNLKKEDWPEAIRSRADITEMNFSDSDMLEYIDKIKTNITANITLEQKTEVMNYIRALWTTGRLKHSINFRLIQLCFDYRLSPSWKNLIARL